MTEHDRHSHSEEAVAVGRTYTTNEKDQKENQLVLTRKIHPIKSKVTQLTDGGLGGAEVDGDWCE